MKKAIIYNTIAVFLAGIAVILLASAAFAQTVSSGAASQSGSSATSYNGGLVQNNHAAREQTIRSAPGVVAPGMSSGHPCAYAPASVGLSIIGGGVSAGGQTVDDACLLAQMGETNAALGMIAARNESACKQLRRAGRIGADSLCSAEEKRNAARNKTAPTRTGSSPVTCERGIRNGKQVIVARYQPGQMTPEQAAEACR